MAQYASSTTDGSYDGPCVSYLDEKALDHIHDKRDEVRQWHSLEQEFNDQSVKIEERPIYEMKVIIQAQKQPAQIKKGVKEGLLRGRKPKPKGSKKQEKLCPVCKLPHMSKNFVRHLRYKHGIQDVSVLSKYSLEASESLSCGKPRPLPVSFDDLPHVIKSKWQNKIVRKETFAFLKKFHLFLEEDESD